jgi:RHS repeat-associated protein
VISLELATIIAQRQVLRYAGYCYDSESGLYYLSARHYDPATRQFLSKDLSRNDGEQSAYGYCLGNPVGATDPSGYRPLPETGSREGDQEAMRIYTKQRQEEARKHWAENQPTISSAPNNVCVSYPARLSEGTNDIVVVVDFLFDAPVQYYHIYIGGWDIAWGDRNWDNIFDGLATTSMTIVISGGKVESVDCWPVKNVRPKSGFNVEYLVAAEAMTFSEGWGQASTLWPGTTARTVSGQWIQGNTIGGVYNIAQIHQVNYVVVVDSQYARIVAGTYYSSLNRGTALIRSEGNNGQNQGMYNLLNERNFAIWSVEDVGNP